MRNSKEPTVQKCLLNYFNTNMKGSSSHLVSQPGCKNDMVSQDVMTFPISPPLPSLQGAASHTQRGSSMVEIPAEYPHLFLKCIFLVTIRLWEVAPGRGLRCHREEWQMALRGHLHPWLSVMARLSLSRDSIQDTASSLFHLLLQSVTRVRGDP